MNATTLLKRERAAMVDFLAHLSAAQWRAETLCEGWSVTDLVAHLVVREQKPVRFILAETTSGKLGLEAETMMQDAKAKGHQDLLLELSSGPPIWYRLPGPSAISNFVENWVHHEDLRRGALNMPRQSDPEVHAKLWSTFPLLGRIMLRSLKVHGIVALQQPSGQAVAFRVGDGFPRSADAKDAAARVIGLPGEIMLFLMGRKAAADVQIKGDPELVQALKITQFSL